ncbi:Uncharacterized protein DAT39_000318, partial [Clarias magur]
VLVAQQRLISKQQQPMDQLTAQMAQVQARTATQPAPLLPGFPKWFTVGIFFHLEFTDLQWKLCGMKQPSTQFFKMRKDILTQYACRDEYVPYTQKRVQDMLFPSSTSTVGNFKDLTSAAKLQLTFLPLQHSLKFQTLISGPSRGNT